jgi:hypothetical protein
MLLSTRAEMEVVTSEDQLRMLSSVHRNLKEYRLGRSIQLTLKNLSTLRRKAHRQGYTRNNFQDRLAQLVVLIKTQDKEFNSLPHDNSFITKRSIHRKNSHLWTTQALDLSTEFVASLFCAKSTNAANDAEEHLSPQPSSFCKRLCRFLRLLLTTTTIKM